MQTIQDVATLLARADMPQVEKNMWLDLVQHLPKELIFELGVALEKDVAAARNLRRKYAKKIHAIVNAKQAEMLKKELG